MFADPNSLVLFHGTNTHFDYFDESSIGRGTITEPNNRFGVWLTPSPSDSASYAAFSHCDEEFPGVLVVEARLAPERVAAYFFNLDDFVVGNIVDSGEVCPITEVFRRAYETEGAEFNVCRAFEAARIAMLEAGFDACWIDPGEAPILAVFKPELLEIRARLTQNQGETLELALSTSAPGGADLLAQEVEPHLQEVMQAQEQPRRPRP